MKNKNYLREQGPKGFGADKPGSARVPKAPAGFGADKPGSIRVPKAPKDFGAGGAAGGSVKPSADFGLTNEPTAKRVSKAPADFGKK